jgi:hypothetical protein
VSSLQGTSPPTWEGLWTGLDTLQLVKGKFRGVERCFAFRLDSSNNIGLWEITKDALHDNTDERIEWSFETASFNFPDKGWDYKTLAAADLWVDDIQGTVNFNLDYRADQHPLWVDWHTWEECADVDLCTPPLCTATFATKKPQYRSRMIVQEPDDSCDSVTGKPYRDGFEFQARLSVLGHARIKKLRLHAKQQTEDNIPTECS